MFGIITFYYLLKYAVILGMFIGAALVAYFVFTKCKNKMRSSETNTEIEATSFEEVSSNKNDLIPSEFHVLDETSSTRNKSKNIKKHILSRSVETVSSEGLYEVPLNCTNASCCGKQTSKTSYDVIDSNSNVVQLQNFCEAEDHVYDEIPLKN